MGWPKGRPRKVVEFETLDGRTVSFDKPERAWNELTPARQAALDRLFESCKRWDREYAERKANGEFQPRKVPLFNQSDELDHPRSRRRLFPKRG